MVHENRIPFFIRNDIHCLKCRHNHKLHKHPWNSEVGKGSMQEIMGYVCHLGDGFRDDFLVFQDKSRIEKQFAGCEMFSPRLSTSLPKRQYKTLKKTHTSEDITYLFKQLLARNTDEKDYMWCGVGAYEILKDKVGNHPKFLFRELSGNLDSLRNPTILYDNKYYIYVFAKGIEWLDNTLIKTIEFKDIIGNRIY